MAFKLKDGSGVEHTYDLKKLKIPSTTEGETVVFTEGEVQDSKTVTITENGTTEVTPDTGYGAVQKVGVTVDVPAPVTSVNGATGDVQTNWYCEATYMNSSDSVTMDKTVAEIYAAYKAGYNVKCKYVDDTLSSSGTIPLIAVNGTSYCIFSGTGAGETLLVPTAAVTRTIYYDKDSASWKYTFSAMPSSYVVTVQKKDGVLTADKTYKEIQQEALRQVLSGGEVSIALNDYSNGGLLYYTSAGANSELVFQGLSQQNDIPYLLTEKIDTSNSITFTATPLSGSLVVNLNDDMSNPTIDKTFDQILEAYIMGKDVRMEVGGMIGHLFSIDDNTALFVFDTIDSIFMVGVQSDNTVEIDLIHPFPLTVNLTKSGDTYSGDATFAEIQAVLEYGQSVQVDYSGAILYLATQTDTQLLFTGLIVVGDGVAAICAAVQSDDTWTYSEVIIKEPTSGS